jgi:hypothetical protein
MVTYMDSPEDDGSAFLSDDSKQLSVSDRRDIEIINRNAERLNREATDTLEYQRLPRDAAEHPSRHA